MYTVRKPRQKTGSRKRVCVSCQAVLEPDAEMCRVVRYNSWGRGHFNAGYTWCVPCYEDVVFPALKAFYGDPVMTSV